MDTLVIFYSFTGRTHYEAKRLAEQENAEVYEVFERQHRSRANAYFFGVAAARRRKKASVEPIAVRFADYEKTVIMCPVWGGSPAPAFNNIVGELTEGCRVDIILTSSSGRVRKPESIRSFVEKTGAVVDKLEVIKTIDLRKRDRKREKKLSQESGNDGSGEE